MQAILDQIDSTIAELREEQHLLEVARKELVGPSPKSPKATPKRKARIWVTDFSALPSPGKVEGTFHSRATAAVSRMTDVSANQADGTRQSNAKRVVAPKSQKNATRTLQRKVKSPTTRVPIGWTEAKIVEHLRRFGGAQGAREIAEATGLSYSTVSPLLAKLVRRGTNIEKAERGYRLRESEPSVR